MQFRAVGLLILAGLASVCSATAQRVEDSSSGWQPVGPAQINSPAYGLLSGRIGSLALDPADPTGNTLYLGALGGGVWKSTNAAATTPTFTPLTDFLSFWATTRMSSLSIGALTVQPGGTGVVLAGTGDGNNGIDSHYGAGLLRSNDRGQTWTLIQNSQDAFNGGRANFTFTGNSFNGFAWNGQTVVAAVGSTASNTNAANIDYSARGLYYSRDGGVSWLLATITDGPGYVVQTNQTNFSGYLGNSVTSVVWNPLRKRFYAAVRFHGYYDSPDGSVWTRLALQPGSFPPVSCPANPGLPASTQCPVFRGTLAVDPQTGDTFAFTVDALDHDQGLFRDTCAAVNGSCTAAVAFATRIDTTALETSLTDTTILGGDYALALNVTHTATDTLLFAGTQDLFRCSLSAGCTWRNTTNALGCSGARVAAAQHAILSQSSLMFLATDGGLWRSPDAVTQTGAVCSADDAAHFENLNAGLGSLAEVASFSQSPVDPGVLMASAGRNGIAATAALPNAAWTQISPSVLHPVAIDQQNQTNWYAETGAGVSISRCTAGSSCVNTGLSATPAVGSAQVAGDLAGLYAPFLLDPADTTRLIVGTCRIWRGAADGSGWSAANNALSRTLDGNPQPSCNGNTLVRALAAGGPATSSGSKVLYAAMDRGGPASGHVFVNFNADQANSTTAWTDLYYSPVANDTANAGHFNPGGWGISSLTVDPHDPTAKTIYVTLATFSGNGYSVPLVYRSPDGGAHWFNITSNLPFTPANALLIDANDASTAYIALDAGVYVTHTVANCSDTGAACWSLYRSGLPSAPAMALLQTSVAGNPTLRAATLGRGIWQTAPVTATNPGHITVAPGSLTFAAQNAGTTSAAQTLTVTNAGQSDVTVVALTVPANFTATSHCTPPLPAQQSCTIDVSFAPASAGTLTGTLAISDGIAPQSVSLTGTALAAPAMRVSPATLSFANTGVGSLSAIQSVTITNPGGGNLLNLAAGVADSNFQIAAGGTCTANLPPAGSCNLNVIFSPTSAGQHIAALTLAADSVAGQTVTLTGISSDYQLSVSGSSSATVKAGKNATFDLAITPVAGSLGFVAFSCTGLPASSGCLFNPTTVALTASSTTQLSIGTVAASARIANHSYWLACLLPVLPFAFRRRARVFASLLVAVTLLGSITGCGVGNAKLLAGGGGTGTGTGTGGGGVSGGAVGTPPGVYTVVVTASGVGITRRATVTLTIQ